MFTLPNVDHWKRGDAMPQINPAKYGKASARPSDGENFGRALVSPDPEQQAFDPKEFLAKFEGGRTRWKYRKDEIVFSQGDPADGVFYIQRGKVKSTVCSKRGKEAVVGIFASGHFFGEGCLAGQPKRKVTIAAMTECSIVRLEKAAILHVLHDEPAFSEMFISHLLSRNIRIEEDLVDQLFNSSERRLARVLLILANYGKEERSEPVLPKLSQEMLAEMIGTTRARVSFFMNKFRRLGFISYGSKLEVHSSLLSVVLSDAPPHTT
jgi:CRP/FNR family cyclic AMP-dependent transcriptional regulator